MTYVYNKVPDSEYKSYEVYSESLINPQMHYANKDFDNKHIYYICTKCLGNFERKFNYMKEVGIYSCQAEVEVTVYCFKNNNTTEVTQIDDRDDRITNIQAIGIPESGENMKIIDGLFHKGKQCFMKVA